LGADRCSIIGTGGRDIETDGGDCVVRSSSGDDGSVGGCGGQKKRWSTGPEVALIMGLSSAAALFGCWAGGQWLPNPS